MVDDGEIRCSSEISQEYLDRIAQEELDEALEELNEALEELDNLDDDE